MSKQMTRREQEKSPLLTLFILEKEYGFRPYVNATTWRKELKLCEDKVNCSIWLNGLVLEEREVIDTKWCSFSVTYGNTIYEDNRLIKDLIFNDRKTLELVIRFATEVITEKLMNKTN